MKTDTKIQGSYIKNLIEEISEKCENRLPCSEKEKLAAQEFANQISRETDSIANIESFKTNPLSYIGILPIIGYMGFFAVLSFYLTPVLSFIISITILILGITHILFAIGAFDFLFKKNTSQNVVAYLEPTLPVEKTIILSSHIDSSWGKPLCFINPRTVILKMVISIISLVSIFIISLIAIANDAHDFTFWTTCIINSKEGTIQDFGYLIMFILPLFSIPGIYWLTQFVSWDKSQAPNGVIDNLTGCELALSVFKNLQSNKDELPENTRIILALFGANKAGMKGAKEFIKKHKNELSTDCYCVNLDSFSGNNFTIIHGDFLIEPRFDNQLIDICVNTIKECNITSPTKKSQFFEGCDSSPFAHAKIKSVTLCAKDNAIDNYTHTINDSINLIDEKQLQIQFEVVEKIIYSILNTVSTNT